MSKIVVCMFLVVAVFSSAFGQKTKNPDNRATVAILGTYHFHNPKLDYAKFEVADVMTASKQKEIESVVAKLAKFRPNKVVVEWLPSETEKTNSDFRDYLDGKFELTRNEVHQIGFRLAKVAGLKRLYLIDHRGSPGDRNIGEALSYAQQNAPKYFDQFNAEIKNFTTLFERMQTEKSIPEILRFMNSVEALHSNHKLYIQLSEIGAGDNFIGAEAATAWYRRNLKIYANLAAIADSGDRILVLYGQGHKPILEQIAADSEKIKVVDVLKYLK